MRRLESLGLSGPVPQSMENCYKLFLLDLGENQFSGTIPKWIGISVIDLRILRLNSNKFEGKIPSTLCDLDLIHILDLSFNKISGTIPSCLNRFTAMADKDMGEEIVADENGDVIAQTEVFDYEDDFTSFDNFTSWIFWKGLQLELKHAENIKLLELIDLSSNILSGFFPRELTYLNELVSLNLSNNNLSGSIPDKIGQMRMLESLDLSHNRFSSEIPRSMANLTTLSYLDLSYNNLTGSIPVSTQLQSFNATLFKGNLGLCGAPLPNSCHEGNQYIDGDFPNTEGDDGNKDPYIYIIIVFGFIVGFWGVCGSLLVKTSWRQKYFLTLDLWKEKFLVALFIGLAKFRRFAT